MTPLLSNIMLNDLDKELEKRGHKFVRYADDCSTRSGKLEDIEKSVNQYVIGWIG